MESTKSLIFRFYKLIKFEKAEIRLILLFSIVAGAFSLALPLAVTTFVNTLGFGVKSMPFMQMLMVLLFLLLFSLGVAGVMRLGQHYLIELIQRRLFVRLASDLSYRLPRVSAASYGEDDGPELVNRFFEIILVQKTTAVLFLQGLNLLLNAGVGVLLLSFYHPFLLGFVGLTALALLLIIFVAGYKGVDTAVEESSAKYRVIAWVEQLAAFPRMFKFGPAQEYARTRIDNTMQEYLDARRRHFRILIRQIGLLIGLELVASVALLGIGGKLVLEQQLTLGQLVASEIILASILTSIAKLGKQFEAWYDTMAAMNKLGYLTALEPQEEVGDTEPLSITNAPIVEVENLAFPVHKGMCQIKDVNFTVPDRGSLLVYGVGGSSQSALFDIMTGMRDLESGSVRLGGRRLESWNPRALNKEIMLLREVQLFDGSLRENLTFGQTEVPQHEVEKILIDVGMGGFLSHHPDGLDVHIISQGKNLASCERAKILLARALLHKPKILFIDKTLSKIAFEERRKLTQLILAQKEWTVIVGSQDNDLADLFGSVYELSTSVNEG